MKNFPCQTVENLSEERKKSLQHQQQQERAKVCLRNEGKNMRNGGKEKQAERQWK